MRKVLISTLEARGVSAEKRDVSEQDELMAFAVGWERQALGGDWGAEWEDMTDMSGWRWWWWLGGRKEAVKRSLRGGLSYFGSSKGSDDGRERYKWTRRQMRKQK